MSNFTPTNNPDGGDNGSIHAARRDRDDYETQNDISVGESGPSVDLTSSHARFSNRIGRAVSVIDTNQEWQYKQPLEAPLGFKIEIDNNGGTETRVLVGDLDFYSAESVAFANEYIRELRTRVRIAKDTQEGSALPPVGEHWFFSAIGGQPKSMLTILQTWEYGKPMEAPLGFMVEGEIPGTFRKRVLIGNLDFYNRDCVDAANDCLRWTRNQSWPTIRRKLNEEHTNWLRHTIAQYAAGEMKEEFSFVKLTDRFNAHFEEDTHRTPRSICDHVLQNRMLRNMKISSTNTLNDQGLR